MERRYVNKIADKIFRSHVNQRAMGKVQDLVLSSYLKDWVLSYNSMQF